MHNKGIWGEQDVGWIVWDFFFNAVENLSLRRDGLQCLLASPIVSCSDVPSLVYIEEQTQLCDSCCTPVPRTLFRTSAAISPSSATLCWLSSTGQGPHSSPVPQEPSKHCLAAALCHPQARENLLMLSSPLKLMCVLCHVKIC